MAKTDSLDIAPFDPAQYLQDEASIAEFLNASIEMNDPAVLLQALGAVARARSMTQLAAASGLGRESLYKALAPGAQPRYDTVMRVLNALGVEIALRPASRTANPAGASSSQRTPVQTAALAGIKPAKPRPSAKATGASAQARANASEKRRTSPAKRKGS